jgi:hypothetical protein
MSKPIRFKGGHMVKELPSRWSLTDDGGDEAVVDTSKPITVEYRERQGGDCIFVPIGGGMGDRCAGGVTFEEVLYLAAQTGQTIKGQKFRFKVTLEGGK